METMQRPTVNEVRDFISEILRNKMEKEQSGFGMCDYALGWLQTGDVPEAPKSPFEQAVENLIEAAMNGKSLSARQESDNLLEVARDTLKCGCCDKTPVSLYVDEDGKRWIRIRTLDQDFLIGTKNIVIDSEDEFKWDDLMEHVNAGEFDIPSREQWALVSAYKKEVEELIEKEGLPEMIGWFWSKSVAQYNSDNAWLFYGNNGYFGNKYYANYGRALAYPKI